MHCLSIQAKADHIYSHLDNSNYLGSGHIHHVSLRCDATSDEGTKHSGVTRLWQQNKPILLVQRELAKPRDEEDLHNCPVCKYLPCPSFTHRNHVRSDWHYTFQNSCSNRRKARPWQPPHCVKEKAKGDKNASNSCFAFHPFLAASVDPHDVERLCQPDWAAVQNHQHLYLSLCPLVSFLQQ